MTTVFFLNEEGKFIENLSVLLNKWKEDGCKFTSDLTFCIYVVREIVFFQGKVREKLGNSSKRCLWRVMLYCERSDVLEFLLLV